ncbi:hypothetical protein LOD99_1866 [Oopsacas minuta]|uniref:Uncharacterized protein n=1 Tax=Oopsacas minuta TaxID=111878 RepID=A0AAV7K3A9_9METZ|nr:hypothetical protein LOD99_1866 [Oopsacas minuta]
MCIESRGEWPSKLQSAIFPVNTQLKQATSFTAFKLIFGRDVQPEYLLNLTKFQYNAINILEDDEEKELNNTEKIDRFDEIGNIQNQFHERIDDNLNQRKSNLDMARRSIEKEQLRLKKYLIKKEFKTVDKNNPRAKPRKFPLHLTRKYLQQDSKDSTDIISELQRSQPENIEMKTFRKKKAHQQQVPKIPNK